MRRHSKFYLLVLFSLTFGLLLSLMTGCSQRTAGYHTGYWGELYYDKGIGAKNVGDFDEAVFELRMSLSHDKNYIPTYFALGFCYSKLGRYDEAIASYRTVIRMNPKSYNAYYNLGLIYSSLGNNNEAITLFKEAVRYNPNFTDARDNLNQLENHKNKTDYLVGQYDEFMNQGVKFHKNREYNKAISSFKEAIRIFPENSYHPYYTIATSYVAIGNYQEALHNLLKVIIIKPNHVPTYWALGVAYEKLGRNDKAVISYQEALKINPNYRLASTSLKNLQDRLIRGESSPSPRRQKEPLPQSGTGSGFFISKAGHVVTNAHVVKRCNRVTIGDNANNQVTAEIINADRRNDLALLRLSTLEMTSVESKSLIKKLGVVVVPLASKGLLRSDDVKLGEEIRVAGYPYGNLWSNTIKVTGGIVSAIRGMNDDSGEFQLDAAVQSGNSGGPIYDRSGNIVGVVVAQLNKRMYNSENVNFGIKASTVRQFLVANGIPSKKSEQKKEKSGEQIAEIARNQTVMVVCYK